MSKRSINNFMGLLLIATWLPTKSLPFIFPLLLPFFFTFNRKNIIVVIFIAVLGLFFGNNILLPNVILSFITYSSILALICIKKPCFKVNKDSLYKTMKLLHFVLVIESILGIIQVVGRILLREEGLIFDGDVGDVVQGSIFPTSFLFEESMNGGNIMFVTNLISGIMFILPYIIIKKKYFSLILFFLLIIIASVLHLIVFWVIASVISSFIIFKLRIKILSQIAIVIFLFFFTLYKFQPSNFELFEKYFSSTFTTDIEQQTPKIASIYLSMVELPKQYPLVLFLGTGAGQFSSRAGLIFTGEYLDGLKKLDKIIPSLIDISEYFKNYGYELWDNTKKTQYGSSTISPVFSWLAFIVEFGVIGFTFFCIYLIRYMIFFLNNFKIYKQNQLVQILSFSAVSLTIFFFLIGFQDLYWEMPQAILPCIIYIILIKEYIKNEQKLLSNTKA